MRRRTGVLLATAVTLLAGLAPGIAARAEAAPTPPEPFGVNGGALWPDRGRLDVGRHAAAISRARLVVVRAVAFWDQAEPQAPSGGRHAYDWRRSDAIVRTLAEHGIRWHPVLCCGNLWADGLPGVGAGETLVRAFSAFAADFARRYGRDGAYWKAHPELPYAPVTGYQIWNEPNIAAFWPPAPQPARYADLYLATRAAIRDVDRHARVQIGGLSQASDDDRSGTAAAFLTAMFAARPALRGNVDAVGVTIYAPTPDDVMRRIATVRRTLDALGERMTPIDLDETGWATRGSIPTSIDPVAEQLRATYLRQVVELTSAADCGLESVTPFAWVTREDSDADVSAWMGIADRADGALKASGAAYAQAILDRAAARAEPLAICGRPDLPRLARARTPEPLRVRVVRRCSRRSVTVSWTLGDEPEAYRRFVVRLPSRRERVVTDPDGDGPRTATTSLRAHTRAGRVRVTAFDALGRQRAEASRWQRRCAARRR